MMFSIKKALGLVILLPLFATAQQEEVLSLSAIIKKIDSNNILLGSYALKAKSYEYSADAATSWMPPMAGIGTFMTPYPFQKTMSGGDKGAIMLRLEQEIPNGSKLQAKKDYIRSLGNIETVTRDITLNELKAEAKRHYVDWLIALRKIIIIKQHERVLETMKKIEELRYPFNQSQLSSVYRAEAEIEKNRNMLLKPMSDIARAKSFLNSFMNRSGLHEFSIDTTYEPSFSPPATFDTSRLAAQRKDVDRMNQSIRSIQYNIAAMRQDRKPDFRIQFDHMYPLSSMMPQAYSIMGMITIPIAPWSRNRYSSEIKSMEFNIEAIQKERSSVLQETQGRLYGMQAQIQTMQKRIRSMEDKVIPALQRTFDASYLSYQENKLSLTIVLDNWEALNMMQLDLLDEKHELYQMIVGYEKELFR